MALENWFKLSNFPSRGVIDLLKQTTLGTNGAKYQHLDTEERIREADNPLYLSMERNERCIANITFCDRGDFWYIRYFAFDKMLQSGGVKKSSSATSKIKDELKTFFNDTLEKEKGPNSFYAYIDPNNERSLWMSEQFGFNKISELATQTFSRINPKKSNRLVKIEAWEEVKHIVASNFGEQHYYFTHHCKKPPYYALKDNTGEVIALTKVTTVNWKIERLPGKWGGVIVKVIPYVPFLRKLIRPANHTFLVPEITWAQNNSSELITELYNAVLAKEKRNLIIWWVDKKDRLYSSVQKDMKWGILNKLIGVAPVAVVCLEKESAQKKEDNPVFVTAYDMV